MDITDKYPDLCSVSFVDEFDFAACSTVTDPEGPMIDLHVAVALSRFNGNLTSVSKALGRSRRSVETFIIRDPLLASYADDIEERVLDDIEEQVRNLALGGDPATARFVLGTKGKKRGYTTRVEQTGPDGGPMNVVNTGMSAAEAAEAYAATLSKG